MNGGLAGKYEIILYSDSSGKITKGEFILSGEKKWGVGINGKIQNKEEGNTQTITLTATGEQLITLANAIENITNISNYANGSPADNIILGPTKLQEEIQNLFALLNSMTISYRVEEETGKAFSFNPKLTLALGAEIELGANIDLEQSVSFLKEEGKITGGLDSFLLNSYEKDNYTPSVDSISMTDIINDAGNGVYTAAKKAGKIGSEIVKNIGKKAITGIKWLGQKVGIFKMQAVYRGHTFVFKSAASRCNNKGVK